MLVIVAGEATALEINHEAICCKKISAKDGFPHVCFFKIPGKSPPRELQRDHPGTVAVDPGSASIHNVVLQGVEVAGGDAGPGVDAGGGSGVNQHRDERELVCEPQQVGGHPVHGLRRVPGMERSQSQRRGRWYPSRS